MLGKRGSEGVGETKRGLEMSPVKEYGDEKPSEAHIDTGEMTWEYERSLTAVIALSI